MRGKLLALFLLFGAAPSYAALSVVQSTNTSSAGSAAASTSVSFNSTPSVGNLIIVTCTSYDFNGTITIAASDNQGGSNSYAVAVSTSQGNTDGKIISSIHYSTATTASGTFTITCTPSAGDYIVMSGYEISGNATAPLDQVGKNTGYGSQSAPSVTTTGATTTADEFVIATVGGGNNTTPTAGSGYTLGAGRSNTGVEVLAFQDEYKIVSVTGSQTADFSLSPGFSSGYGMTIATFKAAAGGGGAAPDNPRRVIISQ